jgi:hypothetical protein
VTNKPSSFSLTLRSSCRLQSSVSDARRLKVFELIRVIVGWADPAPTLSRKRPTADLVSRKVLTPLLGHISLVILAQFAVFKTVQMQPWSVAPNIQRKQHSDERLGSCRRNWTLRRATLSTQRILLCSCSLVSSISSPVSFSALVHRSASP